MSYEVGKQALDFLMDHSGTRHNLEVDFFGGEPLMNFDVVKRLVAYARSVEKERGKHFRFTLTTNGVLIDDDVIDFANREMSNVVLSLDGRKESMTATGWTMPEMAAGRRSFPSSRSWCRPGRGRTTICEGPSPTQTPTF